MSLEDTRPPCPVQTPPPSASRSDKCLRGTSRGTRKDKNKQLRFLGLKWRFLRSDLEKESFPPLAKRPVPGADCVSMRHSAQSAVLDTYVKNLEITGVSDVDSLQTYDYASVVPVPKTPLSQPCTNTCAATDDEIQSKSEESIISKKSVPESVASSELTEADVLLALQNMKIFENSDHISPVRPIKVNIPVGQGSTREHNFVPKPPPTGKPSHRPKKSMAMQSSGDSCSSKSTFNSSRTTSSPRRQRSTVNFANLTPSERQEKLKKIPISHIFKQYAIDNGFRVPKCVATAKPPETS